MTSEPVVGVVFGRPVEGKTTLSYICLPFHSPTQASQLTGTSSSYRFQCHYPLITYLTLQYKLQRWKFCFVFSFERWKVRSMDVRLDINYFFVSFVFMTNKRNAFHRYGWIKVHHYLPHEKRPWYIFNLYVHFWKNVWKNTICKLSQYDQTEPIRIKENGFIVLGINNFGVCLLH